MARIRLTLAQARQSWLLRQRFVGDLARKRSLAETVGDVGWIPATSAVTPYLALFARRVLTTRAELDEAMDRRHEVVVVPGPRGSSWLVPVADAPLARAFAVADHASREARIAAAAGLTARDLEGARAALRAVLTQPLTAAEIRERLPAQHLRSLGESGRKCGMTTVAALVLRNMWVTGEVMRIVERGGIDGSPVRWVMDPRPRTVPTAADAVVVIASRWLAAYAPVSAKAFAMAFGIAAGRANSALKAARPIEVEIEGLEGVFLAPQDFTVPAPSPLPPRLLPLRDPLPDVHLMDLAPPAVARGLLTRNHGVGPSVLVDGELVASWQYDEVTKGIAWRSLGPEIAPEVAKAIDEEAQRTAAFIAKELTVAPLHGPPPRSKPTGPAADLWIEM